MVGPRPTLFPSSSWLLPTHDPHCFACCMRSLQLLLSLSLGRAPAMTSEVASPQPVPHPIWSPVFTPGLHPLGWSTPPHNPSSPDLRPVSSLASHPSAAPPSPSGAPSPALPPGPSTQFSPSPSISQSAGFCCSLLLAQPWGGRGRWAQASFRRQRSGSQSAFSYHRETIRQP